MISLADPTKVYVQARSSRPLPIIIQEVQANTPPTAGPLKNGLEEGGEGGGEK